MSVTSTTLLDAWPIQSAKRIRRKPKRLAEGDNPTADAGSSTIVRAPKKNTHILETGKSERQTQKRKFSLDENGSSSNVKNGHVQTGEDRSYYPGDTPGSISPIPTMHVTPSIVGKQAVGAKTKEDISHTPLDNIKSGENKEEGCFVTFTDAEKAKILNYPIVILKKLFTEDINAQMRDFDDIIANYGNQKVDVLKQNPRDVGFNLSDHTNERQTLKRFLKYYLNVVEKSKKMKEKFAMKGIKSIQAHDFAVDKQDCIRKYSEFAGPNVLTGMEGKVSDNEIDGNPKKKVKLKNKEIVKYCVNVDMRKWDRYQRLLKTRLPRFLMCQEDDDILRFVRQDIEGMTSPQLYIKVPGVWTGGHEENLRFRSINCAHGSGASIWYAVAPEHSKQLRKVVQAECGVDIYEDEGRYFPSVKFLRSHGIPVMTGIQEPGDVVVLKGGTQHWVRSLGHGINTSWNFGLGTFEQLRTAFERYEINKDVQRVDNIVPMKMLLIDYVWNKIMFENEGFGTEMKNFVTSNLQAILKDEIEKHRVCQTEMKHVKHMRKELEHARIIHCGQFCRDRELVNIYAHCKTCQEMNNKILSKKGYRKKLKKLYNVYFCVLCAVEHQKKHPTHSLSVSQRRAGSFDRLVKLMRHPKLNCLSAELHNKIKFECLLPRDEDSGMEVQKSMERERVSSTLNVITASEGEKTHGKISVTDKDNVAELIDNKLISLTEYPNRCCNDDKQSDKEDQSNECIVRTVVHKLL